MKISADIVQPLLDWYDQNKRDLPWRGSGDAYRIWVSEIMLQQTRAGAVKEYYRRFLDALPNVGALASADETELLKLWEGLGYYNRVRNMQKAAQVVTEEYEGSLPGEYELLLKLPGIGEYTAGAIVSIAFDKPCPAVDGNVLRILARLMADDSDIGDMTTRKAYREALCRVIPGDRPGDFNQALMDLGAMVCLPAGAPRCEECPWTKFCRARRRGQTDRYPCKKPKAARRIEHKTVLLIRDHRHTVIRKRPGRGLLAGMYEYPTLDGWLKRKEILSFVGELGLSPLKVSAAGEAVHIFTHKEWHMKGYLVRIEDTLESREMKNGGLLPPGYELILPEEIDDKYPLPSAFKAFRSQLG
ncbi:MAG: A/G-specific adenine glycosylase [Lachnospiraceae bacterium]|nr:A/G-specific adenine glycosylase [Lachnospiraceae bacterium]